jgi:hypothetical protein
MLSRITLALLTLFWVMMNFLLWRSEFGGSAHRGGAVPLSLVWQKILTAPDDSPLDIVHRGQKIGYCRWVANVGQELATGKISTDEIPPEGMVKALSSYRIDLGGSVALGDTRNRLRFDFDLKLTTNHVWQEFSLQLKSPPDASWEISSLAAAQTIHLRTQDEGGVSERVFKLAELENPQLLMQEFGLPVPLELLGAFGFPSGARKAAPLSLGLTWEARNDWFAIGQTSVRAYRLQAKVLDRYRIIIMVSQVGEILRVELPDDLILANNKLTSL